MATVRRPLDERLRRFGRFVIDLDSAALRKDGVLLHLPPQPARVLALLVSRAGELVTREEIHDQIWGQGTFVDFDEGLNHCIKQVRDALGDDVSTASYIETIRGRGYRFIAELETAPALSEPERRTIRPGNRRRLLIAAIAAAVLLAGGALWLGLTSNPDPPRIASIAVLPFENLSGDPEQEFFADGMTEELVTALGRIHALRVISRTSVMRYKRTTKPVPQIARELNVDAIIEGTVTQADGRVRLTANLLYAPDDRHIWADSYERNLSDILGLQRDLARSVARRIHFTLSAEDQARLGRVRQVNPEAHEWYLKGQYHYYRWRTPEFQKAIQYFERAIAADPNYGEAYVGLAKTYGWLWITGALPPNEAYPRFTATLKKALEIDDTLPEVHYVQAVAAWYFFWNWEQAEKEFRRALELNPNLEEARFEYAWFLSTMRRHGEAVAEAERAVSTDPLSVSANLALGSVYHVAGMLDRALEQLRKTIDLEPNDPRCYDFISGVYHSLGLYDELVEARRKAMTLQGATPEMIEAMQNAYRTAGFNGLQRWQLANARNPFRRAVLQAQLGLKDEAFASLEECYRQRWWAMVRLNSNPEWDPLRDDPRFQSLLRRMNFPQ